VIFTRSLLKWNRWSKTGRQKSVKYVRKNLRNCSNFLNISKGSRVLWSHIKKCSFHRVCEMFFKKSFKML
jgi:hypothetical protein